MMITKRLFGTTAEGRPVTAYKLENSSGAYAEILDLGCIVHSIVVPGRDGLTDVCLGYDTVKEYEEKSGYLGAVVGRFANRIACGRFELNGKSYTLARNDGDNHLHGGNIGFNRYIWDVMEAGEQLTLTHISPDGDEGYPGCLKVSVTYRFTESNALSLHYEAVCDADTVINLTNHTYFNLSGHGAGCIEDHLACINADRFCEGDAGCLPTGRLLDVTGTPFDFRIEKAIGRDINANDIQLNNAGGYDHNFCLNGPDAARITSPVSGISVAVETDQPGMQLYVGNFLDDRTGKGGAEYHKRSGFCLETQVYPNAVNVPSFPSPILRRGEKYDRTTTYSFTVR